MIQNYFRHILLCLCLLAGTTTAFANDEVVSIDGIYYYLSNDNYDGWATVIPN